MRFFKAFLSIFTKKPAASNEDIHRSSRYMPWGYHGSPFPVGCFFQQYDEPRAPSVDDDASGKLKDTE